MGSRPAACSRILQVSVFELLGGDPAEADFEVAGQNECENCDEEKQAQQLPYRHYAEGSPGEDGVGPNARSGLVGPARPHESTICAYASVPFPSAS